VNACSGGFFSDNGLTLKNGYRSTPPLWIAFDNHGTIQAPVSVPIIPSNGLVNNKWVMAAVAIRRYLNHIGKR
jgi:hypothetical protein